LTFTILLLLSQTQKANIAGQRAEAARNSKTALVLNHVGVVVGLILLVIYLLKTFYFEGDLSPP